MLHAESLTVTRPGKTPIEARAALPAEFLALGARDG
jgi:tRNA pseudouridine32 synthase/23S rRNA pseudouridine746 synthase